MLDWKGWKLIWNVLSITKHGKNIMKQLSSASSSIPTFICYTVDTLWCSYVNTRIVVLFIRQLRGFVFEQQSNVLACVLFWCTGRAPVCFSKIWNIELQTVKVKCSSLAGDFEMEVNEYLPELFKPSSQCRSELTETGSSLKPGNVTLGFAELSAPKSSPLFTAPPLPLWFTARDCMCIVFFCCTNSTCVHRWVYVCTMR